MTLKAPSAPTPSAARARAEKRAKADALGIDTLLIDQLVEGFYTKVRADDLLGPIFGSRISDWPVHLERMKCFWGSILRGDAQFSGNPMALHKGLPEIERDHFARWLALFDACLMDITHNQAAIALISQRAHAIADSLLTGVRIHRDGRRDLGALKGMKHA